ncbi:5-oxoprolinase subunit PxpB [Paenibacillus algorifonticola]|uniref:5-oxoprolinase subunit PxpB n=1 Tax=Paenibacillus algorifonticola TaxID=684063 RepID=UPI003D2BE802
MSIAPVNPVFEVKLSPLGDTAIIVELGSAIDRKTHERVQALSSYLRREPFPGLIELVPAYVTLTIFYDPMKLLAPLAEHNWNPQAEAAASPYEWVCQLLLDIVSKLDNEQAAAPRIITLPVCYGGELGPDLAAVAEHSGLSVSEVIAMHAARPYLVHMVGFAPGFPYLGGLPEQIATPRRSTPRLRIEPGSVGIGGKQTGVYPIVSPGGWQIIGRTPVALFRPAHEQPSLLRAGDQVNFEPISHEAFIAWEEQA